MKNWKWVLGGGAMLLVAITATLSFAAPTAQAGMVTVYKSPTCGCCSSWVDHMRSSGFTVETVDVLDLSEIKQQYGIAAENQSCHTAIVDGYVVEGHVPADLVSRMLDERPEITGLAVPGMPMGSPGMEGPRKDPYTVYAFRANGGRSTYATRQMPDPTTYERIYQLVMTIPRGRVATYGQIARLVGRCTPRMVGYAMAALPDRSDVPWQRVVNRRGEVSPRSGGDGSARQHRVLEREGLTFDARDRLDLVAFGWDPVEGKGAHVPR